MTKDKKVAHTIFLHKANKAVWDKFGNHTRYDGEITAWYKN